MNIFLWIITAILLVFSFFKDKKKSIKALKMALKKMLNMLPLFLFVMSGFALIITFIPAEIMQKYIGSDSGIRGVLLALGFGSISVMPGFAAFPLCAGLKMQGIPYYVIAGFSVSLMTVGVVTFPIEKKTLGTKIAILRNIISLFIAITAVFVMKIIFGE